MRVELVKNTWTEITDSLKTVQNTSSAVILVSISVLMPTGIEGIKLNPNRAMCFSPESTEKVYGYCTEDRCSVEVADPIPMVGFDGTNFQVVKVNTDGELEVKADLVVSDIEIGAVELKNSDTDERASIEAANTARTIATKVLGVQHIDETGKVLSAVDAEKVRIATELIATAVATARLDNSPIIGQLGVDGGAGVVTAKTQKVIEASDSPLVTNQTDGSQKTIIVDGSGNIIGSTSNALDIHIKSIIAGGLEVVQATAADLNMTEVNSGDIKTAVEAIAADANAYEISSVPAAAAVTAASSAVTLTKAEILNDGVHTIFYRDNGGAADVNDTPLYPGERIGPLTGTIRVICAAAETSTLRITEFV